MRILCGFDELAERSGKGFQLQLQGATVNVVVVRRAGRVYAYRNVCPHRGTTLDWLPDQFMDPDREYLQCATHGALFRVDDGVCIAGPCVGKSLSPLLVDVRDGQVLLLQE
jgi:nitrite reductase/ring-hydroxylating ferredoxin subunit